MARNFNGASNYLIESSDSGIGAYPVSISAWVKPNSLSAKRRIVALSEDLSSPAKFISLDVNGNVAGDPIVARCGFTTQVEAVSPTGTQVDRWHHAGGVWHSSTSRYAYLDGEPGAENTSSDGGGALTALDITTIGVLKVNALFGLQDGDIGHVAIWNAGLDHHEMRRLYRGVSPLEIRPHQLKVFYDLIGGNLVDRIKDKKMSLVTRVRVGPTEPPIRYTRRRAIPFVAAAAPGGAIMNHLQQSNLGADLYNGTLVA